MLRLLFICSVATIALGGVPRSQLEERIVGGRDVEIEDFPFQVSIISSYRHYCGGSLLSPTVVLTAAHCADNSSAPFLTVRAGSSTKETGGKVVKVAQVKQHPLWDSSNIDNDASILILAHPFELSPTIQPIGLVEDHQGIPGGTICTASGWGSQTPWRTRDAKSINQLQAADIPIVSNKDCQDAYGETPVTESMICTGFEEGGVSPCQGDSGGPLVCDGLVAGIVSWAIGCSRPDYPNVYGSVANMRGFIRDASGI